MMMLDIFSDMNDSPADVEDLLSDTSASTVSDDDLATLLDAPASSSFQPIPMPLSDAVPSSAPPGPLPDPAPSSAPPGPLPDPAPLDPVPIIDAGTSQGAPPAPLSEDDEVLSLEDSLGSDDILSLASGQADDDLLLLMGDDESMADTADVGSVGAALVSQPPQVGSDELGFDDDVLELVSDASDKDWRVES
jgi:hypothetical protein